MAKTLRLKPNTTATLYAQNPDDGGGIFVDNVKKVHVDFNQSGSCQVHMGTGQTFNVRFELWNLTGGAYHCIFKVVGVPSDGDHPIELYHANPMNQGGPAAVAWQDTVFLTT